MNRELNIVKRETANGPALGGSKKELTIYNSTFKI